MPPRRALAELQQIPNAIQASKKNLAKIFNKPLKGKCKSIGYRV